MEGFWGILKRESITVRDSIPKKRKRSIGALTKEALVKAKVRGINANGISSKTIISCMKNAAHL
jgi:hypothetical protein